MGLVVRCSCRESSVTDEQNTQVVSSEHDEETIKRLKRLAKLMDTSIGIPGTKFNFGLDALLGLIPGGGDLAGLAISLYLIAQSRQLNTPRNTQIKMLANTLIDAGIGTIPIVGDIFDFFFKANSRNIDLILRELPVQEEKETNS